MEKWTIGTVGKGDGRAGQDQADWQMLERITTRVNAAVSEATKKAKVPMSQEQQEQLARMLAVAEVDRESLEQSSVGAPLLTEEQENDIKKAVISSLFGMGPRLENLLADESIEDIRIVGTRPVIVKLSNGRREYRPAIADSNEELMTLLTQLATHHGGNNARVTSSARPWLNLSLPGRARLAAVWDLTPAPVITIRRHRYVDVTLRDLVGMNFISQSMENFLEACVQGERAILVVGGQGVGKTTNTRALIRALDWTTSLMTLETEYELLIDEIPGNPYPNLVAVESRPGTGERDASGKEIGEVTLADYFEQSLRQSVERYIFGEVRGPEVMPMLQVMSRGQRGSIATFHADSARGSFNALASLMASVSPNYTRDGAMAQIGAALDIVIFIDKEKLADGSERRFVAEIIAVGETVDDVTEIFMPRKSKDNPDEDDERDPRGYPTGDLPPGRKWMRRAGFDTKWLTDPSYAEWDEQFPPIWGLQ